MKMRNLKAFKIYKCLLTLKNEYFAVKICRKELEKPAYRFDTFKIQAEKLIFKCIQMKFQLFQMKYPRAEN